MKPQNVAACAAPGTVHFSSLRCPMTSVACASQVPAGMRRGPGDSAPGRAAR